MALFIIAAAVWLSPSHGDGQSRGGTDAARPHIDASSAVEPGALIIKGLALTIKPEVPTTREGDPIWIDVELHNVSVDIAGVYGVNISGSYEYRVVKAITGLAVQPLSTPNYHESPGGIYMPAFKPGQSMFARVRLDDWYVLAPGTYIVTAKSSRLADALFHRLPTFTSNRIEITVTP